MNSRPRHVHFLRGLLVLGAVLLAPSTAAAANLHATQLTTAGYGATPPGFARTADGTLHAVFDQNTNWGDSYNGIAAVSISPRGHVGAPVQALNWGSQSSQGIPGLAVMPSGAIEATWGGYPFGNDGPWGISSSNGGASWSAPANIGSGSMEFGDSHVELAVSNGTPVLAAGCCGGIVIQQGFGPGAPTYQLTNSTDGCAGNTDLVADAGTGAAVASWDSCDGSGGQWLQQVAPGQPGGQALKMPVPTQYGSGVPPIPAGRDSGPGVFAAYPANYGPGSHIRLLRYGGGSVAVGSVRNLFAHTWGAATGPDGRIWVMWWGQDSKSGKWSIAITRSNKAVTQFEPIQVIGGVSWSSVYSLAGDGRLGPLDMLITGDPSGSAPANGTYYARFLPELSSSVSVHKAGNGKFSVSVKVTDAGDPVAGAKTAAAGHSKQAGSNGVDKLTLKGSTKTRVTTTVSDSGYQTLKIKVKL